MTDARSLESPLLTRDEAARYCRVGLRTFDRRVAPHVRALSIGARILFDRRDIDSWLEGQKDGHSERTLEPAATRSGSRTPVGNSTDPRAQEILRELRSRRRASTPRLFPVADWKPEAEV
jgi:hypothetical protein